MAKKAKKTEWWGIWGCFHGMWAQERSGLNNGVLIFTSRRMACKRAAEYFGYANYAQAKDDGACAVRRLSDCEPEPTKKRKGR